MMGNVIALKDFIDDYGESMAERITRQLNVIHDPALDKEEEIEAVISCMKKLPFPAQAEIIKACYKSFISGNKAVYMVCEMGTGKTLMGIGISETLHKLKGMRRVLVMCPPHLVPKWIQEIKDSLPMAKVYNLNGKNILRQLEILRKQAKPAGLEFYVIGRDKAKTGYLWRPAVITRTGRHFCPKCGQELLDKDGCPLPAFEKNTQKRFKRKFSCENTIFKCVYNSETGQYDKVTAVCNEQLWQPETDRKSFRKVIPARFIKAKMKGFFDLLICDEAHQYKNESGQGYAFGALASACKYILCLTGTLAGGYASDLNRLLFRTHPHQMLEDNQTWDNPKGFIETYGRLEKITLIKEEDGLSTKSKKKTIVKEKPGISPLLLIKFLLPNAVFMRLSDCMEHLQPYDEDVIELAMPPDMAVLYNQFEETLKDALKEALTKGDNSLLGAYLHALLTYPERIYKGVTVIHPHTKEVVAVGPPLEGIMPKERELLSIIKRELALGRKSLVYIQNSDTTDISPRLVSLIEKENIRVKVLKSGDTEGRAALIDKWVEQGMDVLITNPKKVEVGMDLLDFPSIIFYQIPTSTYTLRQASRRSWRIPQTKPVRVYFLTYSGTMQTRLMQLMADKLISSLAIDGELTDKGLAALSEISDTLINEAVKMLLAKSGSGEILKDAWSAFRMKEMQADMKLRRGLSDPEIETIVRGELENPARNIKRISGEIDRVGDHTIKVMYTEYTGKRGKKVTHIEVREDELEEMLKSSDKPAQAQFKLF